MIPEQLRYTAEHEWIESRDNNVLRIGITSYAQDALGDVVFVQLPEVGSTVQAGDAIGEVESTKSVSDIYAPVTGKIVAGNDKLADAPELINSDPYAAGWMFDMEVDDEGQLDALLDAAAYAKLTE
ncbi:glycine cleavage system protein GcvH [Natronoglycomyces albus]|uniref:glycine cleavage system protein GcvH n=1 Tax=Natronoglycomyces albus TaxID=2811108 RepID=UPI0031B5B2D4